MVTRPSGRVLVSLDIGNGFVKARGPNKRAVSYPSLVALLSQALEGFDFSDTVENDFIVGYRGERYAIGDTVHYKGLTPITITHRSRIETSFYQLLFASALSEVVPGDAEIEAVVSLPPHAYWDKDKQKAILSGVYDVQRFTKLGPRIFHYQVRPEAIRIIPEGAGALFSMALDNQGRDTGNEFLARTTVGVIDVGTYTTDLIQLDRLHVVRRGTTSMPHALHDIHERVLAYASSEGVDLDAYRADQVLRDGFFLCRGRRVPLTAKDAWINELVMAISAKIRSVWNGGNDVEYIIVTGGGAPLVEKLLQMEFPHVHLIETVEPFFANCEGGYRYGLLRQREGKG